jgi:hypothetical protein
MSPLGQRKGGILRQDDLFKRGPIHMKFSMAGQEKDDLLIQVTLIPVTAWAGLTVLI